MELFEARSLPKVRIHESPNRPDNHPTSLRSPSKFSTASHARSRPMSVPNAPRDEQAPPPLPPPRYIPELAPGFDPGWGWGKSSDGDDFGETTLPPIRQGSSLLQGTHMKDARGHLEKSDDEEMDLDTTDERASSVSTLRSWTNREASTGPLEPGVDSTPFTASNRLQSERPLEQRSLKASSNQYDRDLLSKFGRTGTLPSIHASSRSDSVPNARSILSPPADQRSHSSVEFPASFGESPSLRHLNTSIGTSPSTRSSWRDGFGFIGTPASATTATSSASDLDQWHQARSHRNSYDQLMPPDGELDHPSDESKAFRQLHIVDSERRASGHGHKRRRRSGSPDSMQDVLPSSTQSKTAESLPQTHPSTLFPRSPREHQPHHGSVSSASSSGFRHGSYASSAGISVGRSSITSASTFDRPSGRMSPKFDPEVASDASGQFSTNVPHGVSSLPTRTLKPAVDLKNSASLPAKAIGSSASRPRGRSKSGGAFVCTCCPKKPKRFTTADELRQHTTEKHYECSYCGNRFKNKNEAERHQNSLHLRRHSWCCAAIAGPEAAFHPTSVTGHSATDSCGYCGLEFPNQPQPDWTARKEHLMVVHKFGECNKAKKFFRADHFRQHLKHSHAGNSGKWTNMLENACMKDEPPPDEASSPATDDTVGLTPASGADSLYPQDEESND